MKLSTLLPTAAFLGFAFTASLALAQGMGGMGGQPSPQGGQQPAQQNGMGMMGGMLGGMMGGGMAQGAAKQEGCGMMNKMASLQERVNQLEQRANPGQAQPSTPTTPR